MAYFPPANGDAQPVFALDINNGAQTGNIGATSALAQPEGPKLDFFKVIVKASANVAVDLRNELGNITGSVFYPGVVKYINQTVQTVATIAFYQVEGSTTGQISYAIYPQNAWTTTTLQTAIQNMGNVQITSSDGTVTGVQVGSSLVTTAGFDLA